MNESYYASVLPKQNHLATRRVCSQACHRSSALSLQRSRSRSRSISHRPPSHPHPTCPHPRSPARPPHPARRPRLNCSARSRTRGAGLTETTPCSRAGSTPRSPDTHPTASRRLQPRQSCLRVFRA
eukprot:1902593-Rhodomonas_salina.2